MHYNICLLLLPSFLRFFFLYFLFFLSVLPVCCLWIARKWRSFTIHYQTIRTEKQRKTPICMLQYTLSSYTNEIQKSSCHLPKCRERKKNILWQVAKLVTVVACFTISLLFILISSSSTSVDQHIYLNFYRNILDNCSLKMSRNNSLGDHTSTLCQLTKNW